MGRQNFSLFSPFYTIFFTGFSVNSDFDAGTVKIIEEGRGMSRECRSSICRLFLLEQFYWGAGLRNNEMSLEYSAFVLDRSRFFSLNGCKNCRGCQILGRAGGR